MTANVRDIIREIKAENPNWMHSVECVTILKKLGELEAEMVDRIVYCTRSTYLPNPIELISFLGVTDEKRCETLQKEVEAAAKEADKLPRLRAQISYLNCVKKREKWTLR